MTIAKGVLDAIRVDSVKRTATKNGGRFMLSGTIKWWDAVKGIGWIKPDLALPDVKLHMVAVMASGLDSVSAGDTVECEVLQRPRGLQTYRIVKHTPA